MDANFKMCDEHSSQSDNEPFASLPSQPHTSLKTEITDSTYWSQHNYKSIMEKLLTRLSNYQNFDLTKYLETEFNESVDCVNLFIKKTLDTIQEFLSVTLIDISSIVEYLVNAAMILNYTRSYFNSIMENIGCHGWIYYAGLPVGCANILRNVFTHCNHSERLYKDVVSEVQEQLKNLFRSGHELQMAYFKIFYNAQEKNLQPTIDGDYDRANITKMLSEALRINIDIGRIVVSLDVKTTAEQWKGVVVMCEQHLQLIVNEDIVGDAIDTLIDILRENIRLCVEGGDEQQPLQRTLKVSNFLIKIVIKLCLLFKPKICEDYTGVVRLLVAIKGADAALEHCKKTEKIREEMASHIGKAVEPLIGELLDNADFAKTLLLYSSKAKTSEVIGCVLLLASVMSAVAKCDDESTIDVWLGDEKESSVVCAVVRIVSKCHTWLGCGLQFTLERCSGEPPASCSLYEHLLVATGGVSVRATELHYAGIESCMVDTLLTGDEWSAMFVADLWLILARYSTVEFVASQISSLAEIHTRLKTGESPQRVHLAHVIRRLYCTLATSDIRAACGDSTDVVEVVGLKHLVPDERESATIILFDKIEAMFGRILSQKKFNKEELYEMIDAVRLASTWTRWDVSSPTTLSRLIEATVSVWLRCCPTVPAEWFGDLVLALTYLTRSFIENDVIDNVQLVQILDVLSTIVLKSTDITMTTLKISFLRILKALAHREIPDDAFAAKVCNKTARLFRRLLKDENPTVRYKSTEVFIYFSLRTGKTYIISKTVQNDAGLKRDLIDFMVNINNPDVLMEKLKETENVHKNNVFKKCETAGSNFNLVDDDILFEDDNFEEPTAKKAKIEIEEVRRDVNSDENAFTKQTRAQKSKRNSLLDDMLNTLDAQVSEIEIEAENLEMDQADRIKSIVVRLQSILK